MSIIRPMFKVPSQTSSSIDELLRLQTFTPHVGSEFLVLRGSEWVPVMLAEAKDHRRKPASPSAAEQFSLIFTAGTEKPLQQGIHEFEHPDLARFELFITPVMCPHPDVRWYEAVINRETPL
jgi:hypothetical protein